MFIEQADNSPHKLDASIVAFLHQRPLRVQGSQAVFSVFLDKQCIIYLEDANFTIARRIVTLDKYIALIYALIYSIPWKGIYASSINSLSLHQTVVNCLMERKLSTSYYSLHIKYTNIIIH